LLKTNKVISNLKKKRKEDRRRSNNPNWSEMESFSAGEEGESNIQPSQAPLKSAERPGISLKERIVERVLAHLRGEKLETATARETKGSSTNPGEENHNNHEE